MKPAWLKMIYVPGKEREALGEFRQSVKDPDLWRLVHQTSASQRYPKYRCPGGVDVGLIDYLDATGFAGTYVLRYKDTAKTVFEIPMETLLRHRRSGLVEWTMTPRGRRHRVFIVDADWTTPKWDPAEYLAGPKRIQKGDTIHIDTDGNVIPHDRVLSVDA